MAESGSTQHALGERAAFQLANVTKTPPQYGAITPRWLVRFLDWKPLEAGTLRVNRVVQDERTLEVVCDEKVSHMLPESFVNYEEKPREYTLNSISAVVDVRTKVSDLFSNPFDQVREQLRLTIEAVKERQESELLNNSDYGLLNNVAASLPTEAGTYQVAVNFTSADPNFTDAAGAGVLTISPATPTISLAGSTIVYDGNAHPAGASAVGVDGVTPVDGSFSYTYNGAPDIPVNAGTYSVVATFNSNNPDYGSATAAATLTINPTAPAFVVLGGTVTYNGAPQSATSSAIGVDGVTPAAGTVAYTYNSSSTAPTSAGTYVVAAVFTSSDPNYLSAAGAATLVINQAAPTLTLTAGTFNYNGAAHAAVAGEVGVDGVTPVAGRMTITYKGSSTVPINAGTYVVVAAFTSSNANYSAASATGTLIIKQIAPVFGNLSSPTILAGASTTTLGGTISSGTLYPSGATVSITLNGTTKTAIVSSGGAFSASFTTSGLATSNTPYAIAYSFAGNTNFTAASGAGALAVASNPPVVTTSPVSQTVVSGKTATFIAAATGAVTPTVQWQASSNGGATWTNITGATKTTYSFAVSASQNGYEYRAVFSNVGGTAATSAATLTVQTPPAVTTSPKSQTVVAGASVTFTAAASGNPTPSVQWQVSTNGGTTWTNITGATQTQLTFTTTAGQNGYRYRAVFTSSAGTATTSSATLTVQSPPVVSINPLSRTVLPGNSVTFSAAATGVPTPTVQWQVSSNGGATWSNISGATKTTLTFTVALTQNGYRYRAVFTNSAGSAATSAAVLTA